MSKNIRSISYTLLAAGATKTFAVSEPYGSYKLIPDGGAIALAANITIRRVCYNYL